MKYIGNDNYGRPKSAYLDKISTMCDDELERETYGIIYQSARCANRPGADWHWQADACWDEARKRHEDARIYCRAYAKCVADHT